MDEPPLRGNPYLSYSTLRGAPWLRESKGGSSPLEPRRVTLHVRRVVEARSFKAELCRSRAKEIDPFVSKSCYEYSARLLADGHTSWTNLT